jgi:hypothetical protein
MIDKKRRSRQSKFFCWLSTLTIDINIYNYQIRLYVCILCKLTKAFEHQYIIYVVTFRPPLALLFETQFRSSFGWNVPLNVLN